MAKLIIDGVEHEVPDEVRLRRDHTLLDGQEPGVPGGIGDVRINGKKVDHRRQHVLSHGDTVLVSTPGGGGYGPPRARARALRKRDVEMGYSRQGKR